MKRNQVSLFVALVVVIGLLLAACSTPAPATPPKTTAPATTGPNYGPNQTVKFAFTLKEQIYTAGATAFQQTAATLTNGVVKTDIFGEGSLYDKPQDLLVALSTNAIQMGLVSPGDMASWAAQASVVALPGVFQNRDQVTKFLADPAFKASMDKTLAPKGIKYVAAYSTAFAEIFTVDNLKTLADLKGKKIRQIPGMKGDQLTIQAYGAVPVTVNAAELQTSLQQKMIDGACTVLYFYVQNSWPDAAKYRTGFNATMGSCFFLASQQWYNSLTPDLKNLMDTKIFPAGLKGSDDLQAQLVKGADEAGIKRGMVYNTPSAADLATATAAIKSVRAPLEGDVGPELVKLAESYGGK